MLTARKVPKYRVFSGPYIPVFGLNTETYGVKLRIQSKYGKILTRKDTVFGHFLRSGSNPKIKTSCKTVEKKN